MGSQVSQFQIVGADTIALRATMSHLRQSWRPMPSQTAQRQRQAEDTRRREARNEQARREKPKKARVRREEVERREEEARRRERARREREQVSPPLCLVLWLPVLLSGVYRCLCSHRSPPDASRAPFLVPACFLAIVQAPTAISACSTWENTCSCKRSWMCRAGRN